MDSLNRREFLAQAGMAFSLGAVSVDSNDPIASAAPARWAASELAGALAERKMQVRVVAAGRRAAPDVPESLAIVPGKEILACGSDVRGLVYALLELAGRVRRGQTLEFEKPVVESPANRIRSIKKCFVSEVEDKPWFYDREAWRQYLTMLASERFNRFNLAFGIGYDFTWDVRDSYLHFPYPFLVAVEGYNVRVAGLAEAEREKNLETLRFISDETAGRGLDFQLGVWTHAYDFSKTAKISHTVEGLTPETQAAYCRDALRMVLEKCPSIRGVTFRIHGESGVAEGSYGFWRTIFEGVAGCGRQVGIDLHAKGIDQGMIDTALATGLSVTISPKYWAEHLGLPYHQAAIRALERVPRQLSAGDRRHQWPAPSEGLFSLSSGSRSFMRYGYGDLLREDRRYGILHRIWPGTQRLLLWADPGFAATCSRASSFCGSDGAEVFEPLSMKGRKGSGVAGGRCGYADASLAPRHDWEKYLDTYRVWGRLLYNPAASVSVHPALAEASRLLPLVTMAHCPSAANNNYWPEMYTNMSIVDAEKKHPYGDTPSPKRFGTVSPLDPELFARVDDFAEELLKGERGAEVTPAEVAAWLERTATASAKHLAQAETSARPEFRRMAIDVAIEIGLGRFFAWKLRSGVLWALYDRTGERAALEEALKAYRAARGAWAELANRASSVYASDVTFGWDKHLRGHWRDRLPAIDEDIAEMAKRPAAGSQASERVAGAIREVLSPPPRPVFECHHAQPARFQPGEPLEVELASKERPAAVRLHYRRVNQAELWRVVEMAVRGDRYAAAVPGDYTASPFPLQYYFELRDRAGAAALFPGLARDFSNQPYFVVRQGRREG